VRISIAGPAGLSGDEYVEALRDAVDGKASGIMLNGWGESGAILIVDRAVKSGIPVVTVETDEPSSMRVAHLGPDKYLLGRAMGRKMAGLVEGRGRLLVLGMTGLTGTKTAVRGFRNAFFGMDGIEIVGVEDDCSESPVKAEELAAGYLEDYPDLAGIAGLSVNSGPGAAAALGKAGLEGKVRLVCVDSGPESEELACRGIADTVFSVKWEAIAFRAFQMLYSYNNGSAATGYVPGLINIPGNIDTGHLALTGENIENYENELGIEETFRSAELAQRIELLSGMIENISEMAIATDSRGRVIYANPAALRVSGMTEEGIGNRTLSDLFALDDKAERSISVCLEKGAPGGFESRTSSDAASGIPVKVGISPILLGSSVRGLVVIAVDLSEQKRFIEALRRERERYRLLVDNATDLIVKIGSDRLIKFVSPAYSEKFGRDEKDLVGSPFIPSVHEEDRELAEKALERLEEEPHTCYVEQRELTASGWRWFGWAYRALLDGDGRIDSIIGVGRDITSRKSLEDQVLQAQKMEAIGQLAGGIAHDFNNVLVAVLASANLLKLESEPGSRIHDTADTIERAADKASELTRQLLGFARRERGRVIPVDMNAIIKGVVQLLGRTMNRNIRIQYDTEVRRAVVTGDPAQLERVILNIAMNSRDAMPDGGTLEIHTAWASQEDVEALPEHVETPGTCLKITISDEGVGIPAADLDRVFEPFFTTKEYGTGAGMGLATAYGITRSHGGSISMSSIEGEGTVVTILLPAEEEFVSAAAETDGEVRSGSGRVMVVDDEELVLKTARDVLEKSGYEVLTFIRCADALEYFRGKEEPVDVVILDLIMPDMDGLDCFGEMKRIDPLATIILSTGYVTEAYAREVLDEGASGFLPKPYTATALSQAVQAAMER